MKSKLLLTALFTIVYYHLFSQVPSGFNYQAVAGDASGIPLRNTDLQVKISILSDTLLPVTVWEELHSTVRTNAHGIFSLVVGSGVRQPESLAAAFNEIDWTAKPLFIKTQLYYQSSWKNMGSAKLWTGPYAMVAGDLTGSLKKLGVKGVTSSPDSALFEVKNKNGQTVFAVYNEGVRVYVDDGVAKGSKGGFAIGGFDQIKAEGQNYLFIDSDSIRMYIDNNPAAKKSKGGFAIGGFDALKGPVVPFVDLTPKNYFIGHEAGLNITTGLYNTFFGYQAGRANKDGDYNIFIGHQSGLNTLGPSGAVGGSEGSYNCYIGYQSGYLSLNGANNTAIGYVSGYNNQAGNNTFLGSWSGYSNKSGGYNTFIGTNAGWRDTSGNNNVFLGQSAGNNVRNGSWNTMIGSGAGANISSGEKNIIIGSGAMGENYFAGSGSGSSNIVIGFQAGYSAANSSSNIFIGNQAGFSETGSNRLYISSSTTKPALIWGDFENGRLGINTNESQGFNLYVNGTSAGSTSFAVSSDERLKEDIVTIPDALFKVLHLRGVNFAWKDKQLANDKTQMGFIAQEAETIIPEVIIKNSEYYQMQYAPLTALLVEAIKEQQQQIESTKQENRQLKSELQSIKEKMEQIESMLAKTTGIK
jgi:hypothetical protein